MKLTTMKIPIFPFFKKMDIGDRDDIESLTSKFLPYSDYNFVSLWSYNTKNDIMISSLNNNLVVKFRDYIQPETHFYSFIGINKTNDTVNTLFSWMIASNISPYLKLIPEIVIQNELDQNNKITIKEDEDNFDYVMSLSQFATLTGNANSHKRWRINKFTKSNTNITTAILPLHDKQVQMELLALFDRWAAAKNIQKDDSKNERTAIQRLLHDLVNPNLVCIGVQVQGKIIGFSIEELLQNNYAMGHFIKIDFSDTSAYDYLRKITADYLLSKKCIYLNYEQDLGEKGLRESKRSLKPVHYLKKYIISPKK